ncbi:MAG: helix-turn-helix transcriptional regulator, partial [Clostridia bacterium]|nr:helix-turn-helix transcriptional regulator [Clostridia bacterium]
TLVKYINGKAECPASNIIKIARYYGVSTDYLLGNSPNPTTDEKLQGVCKYTGLSEKAVLLFKEIKELDTERELSRFFENDIGKSFLLSIVEYCSDVKRTADFRGHLASASDEPFMTEIIEELRLTEVQDYEVIAYRISQYLQRYFDERAKEIYQPVTEYEKQRNDELLQIKRETDEWIKNVLKDGEE